MSSKLRAYLVEEQEEAMDEVDVPRASVVQERRIKLHRKIPLVTMFVSLC